MMSEILGIGFMVQPLMVNGYTSENSCKEFASFMLQTSLTLATILGNTISSVATHRHTYRYTHCFSLKTFTNNLPSPEAVF